MSNAEQFQCPCVIKINLEIKQILPDICDKSVNFAVRSFCPAPMVESGVADTTEL